MADKFATIAWYKRLSAEAGASSIAGFSQKLEPRLKQFPERYKWLHRQWAERAIGRRLPGARTIAAAERHYPGASCIFNLALWPALRADWSLERCHAEVVRRVDDPTTRAVEAWFASGPRRGPTKCATRALRAGTIDDLSGLLLLLRAANEDGAGHAAYSFSRAVNRALLIQAGWLLAHGLLLPVIEFVDENFFQRVPAPFDSTAAAGSYFRELEWLASAAPRQMPELAEGFDAEMWASAAHAAFRKADRLGL
ncbi:hypothetical protein [Ideonella sp.]|uniref:hypothetical protein n=1 Tax=Ideonella sp. TaxID=1929293 RepID=UPI003BB4BF72